MPLGGITRAVDGPLYIADGRGDFLADGGIVARWGNLLVDGARKKAKLIISRAHQPTSFAERAEMDHFECPSTCKLPHESTNAIINLG